MASAGLEERPPARETAARDEQEDKDKDDQLVPTVVVGVARDTLFNARVRKSFGSRVFWGTIVGCYWIAGGLFYKVSFDDGDVDIFEAAEAMQDVKQARAHRSEDTQSASDAAPAPGDAEPVAEPGTEPATATTTATSTSTSPAPASEPKSPATYHGEMRHQSLKRKRDDATVNGQPNVRRVQLWGQRLYASIFTNDAKETFVKELLKTPDGEAGEMEASGHVQVGDIIIAVNGTRTLGLLSNKVSDLIRKARRPIWITFYRPTASQVAQQFAANAQSTGVPLSVQAAQQTPPTAASSIQPPPGPAMNQQPAGSTDTIPAQAGGGYQIAAAAPASFGFAQGGVGQVGSLPQSHTRHFRHPMIPVSGQVGPVTHASGAISFPVAIPGYPGGVWTMHTMNSMNTLHTPPVSSFQQMPTSHVSGAGFATPALQFARSTANRIIADTQPSVHTSQGTSSSPSEQFDHTRRTSTHDFGHGRWNRARQAAAEQVPLPHSVPGRRPFSTPAADNTGLSTMQRHRGETAQSRDHAASSLGGERSSSGPARSSSGCSASWQSVPLYSTPSQSQEAADQGQTSSSFMRPDQTATSFLKPEQEDSLPASHSASATQRREYASSSEHADAAHISADAVGMRRESSAVPSRANNAAETALGAAHEVTIKAEKTRVDVDADAAAMAALTEPDLEVADDAMDADVDADAGQVTSFLNPAQSSFVSNLPSTDTARPASAHAETVASSEVGSYVVVTIQRPRLYLTLGTQGSFVAVTSFVRDDHGRRGEVEESGKVFIGDVLVGINTARIEPMTTPTDIARVVSALPRPLVLSFKRASWDVLEGKE